MEFEDHYVTCSLKHTTEHWLWCAVLLIEVFGLFWCLMVVGIFSPGSNVFKGDEDVE
jgi:hypothetical protein